MTKRKTALASFVLFVILLCLATPSYNVIDVLPDLIAYLLLAGIVARYKDYAPYFAEAHSALVKLSLVSAVKIPAMMIMFANMSTGRDIVPLFTLSFAVIELILLVPAIRDGFSAVFYVAERGGYHSASAEIRLLGTPLKPEFLEGLSVVFVFAKAVFNVIPELCLLTAETATAAVLLKIYPTLVVISLLAVFLFGIVCSVIAWKYFRGIIKDGGFDEAVHEIAGDERIARVRGEAEIRRAIAMMTVLFTASFLTPDLSFSEINHGNNLLPRAIFAIVVWLVGTVIFEKRQEKLLLSITALLYTAASLINANHLSSFLSAHTYRDLIDFQSARDAYLPHKVWSVIELVCFTLFILVFLIAFLGFLKKRTVFERGGEELTRSSLLARRRISLRGIIFSLFPLLINILKTVNVFLLADVELIYSADASVIVTSVAPWFSALIFAVCVAYIFYSQSFTNEIKEEIRLKYADEHQDYM